MFFGQRRQVEKQLRDQSQTRSRASQIVMVILSVANSAFQHRLRKLLFQSRETGAHAVTTGDTGEIVPEILEGSVVQFLLCGIYIGRRIFCLMTRGFQNESEEIIQLRYLPRLL